MSYILNKIIVRELTGGGSWITSELVNGELHLDDLYNTYYGIVLELSSTVSEDVVYLDIYHLIPGMLSKNISVNAWLDSVGYRSLPVSSTPPNVTYRSVMYMDAYKANYDMAAISRNRHPDMPVDQSEKTDLLLTRPDTDYDAMNDYCLVSINGIFHYSDAREDGLVVHDGVRGFEVGNTFHVGIHSFSGIAPIVKVPVTADMISRVDQNIPLSTKLKITHAESLVGKTLIMSLGGYLHYSDDVFTTGPDNTIIVDVKKFLLPERVFDSLRRTDIRTIHNLMTNRGVRSVAKETLFSDEFIQSYFSSENTFMIIVDTPVLYKAMEITTNDRIPGNYTTKRRPVLPLVTGMGRVCEYWPEKEYTTWVLHCSEPCKNGFSFNTIDPELISLYTSDLEPGYEHEDTTAYFLNLYIESLTVPD